VGAPERALHELRPQARQEIFLSSQADIAIYGGSAFSGKTFSMLLDPLRYKDMPNMSATFFRRTMKQADNPGGLWDESCSLYAPFGCTSFVGPHEHRFMAGMTVTLAGMEMAQDRFAWDGAQIPLLYWDQLEHFEAIQFWYMLSRNRDPSGRVRPYTRATCNPDPDSWLAKLIEWWIDQDKKLPDGETNPRYGYAIPERAGVIRWFVRLSDDSLAWGDTREELMLMGHGNPDLPIDHPEQPWMSLTYIYATIYDNPIGMARDPGYLAKLRNMQRVERERLLGDPKLGGNWKIRAAAGLMFKREWCTPLPAVPADLEAVVRYWDLAATKKTENMKTDPAWTVGVKLGRYRRTDSTKPARFVILDVRRMQESAAQVRRAFKNTATADGQEVRIGIPQDPGQAGKDQAQELVGLLPGFDVRTAQETGDKVTRFSPFSAQAEVGNVDYVLDAVPEEYLASLENFPDGKIKDDADATAGAFRELCEMGGPVDLAHGTEVSDMTSVDDTDSPWGMH